MENDQDVLIPAFIAAYTSQSAEQVTLSAFPSTFPIPNWDVRYTGLSKINGLKDTFKSVTLSPYQSI